jgi:hypothetical protein
MIGKSEHVRVHSALLIRACSSAHIIYCSSLFFSFIRISTSSALTLPTRNPLSRSHLLLYSLRVWSIIPRLTGTFAWSVAVAFLFDCRFVYLEFYQVQVANMTSIITAEPLRFGLLSHAAIELTQYDPNNTLKNFTLHNTNECLRYSDKLQTTHEFATAQVCAIVCVVLGGILTWMLWIMYCCRFVCLCIPSIIISLGFLVVLPVLQATTMVMLHSVCHYRLDEAPLLDLIQPDNPHETFEFTEQKSNCGMSGMYGLYYPVSVCFWIVTGILFLAIRPRKNSDLDAVNMLR